MLDIIQMKKVFIYLFTFHYNGIILYHYYTILYYTILYYTIQPHYAVQLLLSGADVQEYQQPSRFHGFDCREFVMCLKRLPARQLM